MTLYEVSTGGRTYKIEIERAQPSSAARQSKSASADDIQWNIRLEGQEIAISCLRTGDNSLSLIINGESYELRKERTAEGIRVFIHGTAHECLVWDPRSLRGRQRAGLAEGGAHRLTASMPGKVVRVLARAGDTIAAGQGIVVIEAMKMQNEVRSPKAGVLKQLAIAEGANVNAGEMLAIIE
jgi:biotin carboxyl carrier protein